MYERRWIVMVTLALLAPIQALGAPAASNETLAQAQPDTAAGTAQSPPPPPPPVAVAPTAPDFPRGKISGLVFGDLYWNAAGDPTHNYTGTSDGGKVNIDGSPSITRDLNGTQIRRLYFQLDNDLSIKYSTRLRLEADSKSLTSDGKLGLAVKALYIQARNVYPRGDAFFGVLSTPTYEYAEDFWGYRAIEKTIADFRGLGTSADIGAELKGFFDPDHRVGYSAMVGNGAGQKPEDNRDKKGYLALPSRFGDLKLEPYVDYENLPNHQDKATYKLFAGYEARLFGVGAEAVDRVNHKPSGPNEEPRGLSVYVRTLANPTWGGFARVDLWQPNHNSPNRVDSELYIAGLDFQPFKDVHFMPNIEAVRYRARGTAAAPKYHDAQVRLTVYYRFVKPQS